MKKFILTIGAIAATAAPVAAVIACNDNTEYTIPTLGDMYKAGKDNMTKILSVGKDAAKKTGIAKIKEVLKDKDLQNKYIEFVNNQRNWKDAYYLIKFAQGSMDPQNMANAKTGLLNSSDPAAGDLIKEIISQGKLSLKDASKGIVEKFGGEDERFDTTIVQLSATYNKETRTLKHGDAWPLAANAMGGNEVVVYILEAAGYHFA